MAASAYNEFINTAHLEQQMIGWTGTVFGIMGAILVASNSGVNDIGYIFFTVGSLFSLISSIKARNNANITLWAVFLIINIFGLVGYSK